MVDGHASLHLPKRTAEDFLRNVFKTFFFYEMYEKLAPFSAKRQFFVLMFEAQDWQHSVKFYLQLTLVFPVKLTQ